jgi:[glutamine synthetase] adenylyltransferase / [glutamine synthetase]-adenylyl-L-tyrosine phosphorylase
MVDAYGLLARFLIAERLLAPSGNLPPPAACAALARACRFDCPDGLLAAIAAARQEVARNWTATFGETLEIDPT